MTVYTDEIKELLGSLSDDASVPLHKKLKLAEPSVVIRLANIWRMTTPNPVLRGRRLLSSFYLISDPKGMPYMAEGFSFMNADSRRIRVEWVESDQVYGFVLGGKSADRLSNATPKWPLFLFRDIDETVTVDLYLNIERMIIGTKGV